MEKVSQDDEVAFLICRSYDTAPATEFQLIIAVLAEMLLKIKFKGVGHEVTGPPDPEVVNCVLEYVEALELQTDRTKTL